jgi:hypothetical protein
LRFRALATKINIFGDVRVRWTKQRISQRGWDNRTKEKDPYTFRVAWVRLKDTLNVSTQQTWRDVPQGDIVV